MPTKLFKPNSPGSDFDNRMSILCPGKAKIVKAILEDDFDLVFDLGAGQCVIGLELAKNNFFGLIVSVDKDKPSNWSDNSDESMCKHCFIQDSLGHFADTYKVKKAGRIAVVLSAVLHELDIDEFIRVQNFLSELSRKYDVAVFIREPYYDDKLFIGSFVENEVLRVMVRKDEQYEEYLNAPKKSWALRDVARYSSVSYLNYMFLLSYGEEAWEREKHEGRFTFSWEQICDFLNECGLSVAYKYYERDPVYANLGSIYDSIRYTSCLIVADNNKERN